jgi:hypothetical protein
MNLSPAEKVVVKQIKEDTNLLNKNNITRTEAYLKMYLSYPELHWAFLAHMVSRNGGWSMTDLKGDLIPHILGSEKIKHFFLFLERCNALIFQDAYPQLRLYDESIRQGKILFHLLPAFHVSRFMKPYWDSFLKDTKSQPLTIALIINEQNYIEKRVVQHPIFKRYVLDSLEFKTHALLQLTQIIFPYVPRIRIPFLSLDHKLAGSTLLHFDSLRERINIGKELYAILFKNKKVHEGITHFAKEKKHTGSRSDFWPHLYTFESTSNTKDAYEKERLKGCHLIKGATPLYSPELEEAWGNYVVAPPELFDWYTHQSVTADDLKPAKKPTSFDMTLHYCLGLKKVELAALAIHHFKDKESET